MVAAPKILIPSANDFKDILLHGKDTVTVPDPNQDTSAMNRRSVDSRINGRFDGSDSGSRLRLTSTSDASLSSTAHALQIGPSNGVNLAMDTNEIVVRNNGSPNVFNLAGNMRVTVPTPDHDQSAARVDWMKNYIETQTTLWTGGLYMQSSQTVTPSSSLLSQKTGWILVWSAYSGGSLDYEWSYQIVPRMHATFANGQGVNMVMGDVSVGDIHKYVYVSNTNIIGHDNNSVSPNNQRVLRRVIGF